MTTTSPSSSLPKDHLWRRPRAAVLVFSLVALAGCGEGDAPAPAADVGADGGGVADLGEGRQGDADGDLGLVDAAAQDMGPELVDVPPGPWPIDRPGPYNVGFLEETISYDAIGGGEEPRALRVAFWYPTRRVEGRVARYGRDIFARPGVFEEVAPAEASPGGWPVLVFSHGNSGIAEQSFFMTEFFASHGWIVVAPDHTHNTLFDNEGAINLKSGLMRPQDIRAVLDHALGLPAEHLLEGLADADRVAMSGHSFGGFTTLAVLGAALQVDELEQACEADPRQSVCSLLHDPEAVAAGRQGFRDPRIKVAIPQTPGGWYAFQEGIGEITAPVMVMTGGMDRTLPNAQEGDPIWAALMGPQHVRVNLPRAGHFTFSNMCTFVPQADMVKNDGCGEEFLPFVQAHDIINTYAMAFARRVLFDDHDHDDLLEGRRAPYGAEVEMSFKR